MNTDEHGGASNIFTVHRDIIGAHILPHLDGVSLASFASASSEFRSVAASNERRLWRHVTTSMWPSARHPRVQSLIALCCEIGDPVRRAIRNLSSFVVVATERHWLTGDISVKYSTVIRVDRQSLAVDIEVKGVTCSGEMHVREVEMRVEDLEGKWMNGKESLGILVSVMECGVKKIDKGGFREKKRYQFFRDEELMEGRKRKEGEKCGVSFY